MFKSLFIATLLLTSVSVYSQEIPPEMEITHVEITEIAADKSVLDIQPTVSPIDSVIMYLDGIIAIGKKIWPIIEAGKPVINTTGLSPAVSVLPPSQKGTLNTDLSALSEWSVPRVTSYRVSYKNGFDSEVIGFTFSVIFQYNGNLNGVGKYITGLRVQASEVSVSWGFDFSASSGLMSVANVGSSASPVASAIFQINYAAKSVFKDIRSTQSFYVDGKGNLKLLNN